MKALKPSPSSLPEPDPVLGQHHANLAALTTELDALERLSDRWRDLVAELAREETNLESTAAELVSGQADDAAFAERSDKVAAIEARIRVVKKLTASQGSAIQKRLQLDIPATEYLVGIWLGHRLQVEAARVLESVPPEGRGLVREAGFIIGEATTAYQQSKSLLGQAAGMSWLWQRPIEIEPTSEKNLSALRNLNDALWKSPDPFETVQALLEAAKAQKARWQALLDAIAKDVNFIAPSTYEEPKPAEWVPGALAGISSGPPTTPGIEDPKVPPIKYDWTEDDLKHVPWEQKAG